MPRTLIAAFTPPGPFPGSVGAGSLTVAPTPADTTNYNKTPLTGREVLIAINTTGSAHNVTVTSAPDEKGRTEDITSYSLEALEVMVFDFHGGINGWQQSDGNLYYQADNAGVLFIVLQLNE